MMIRQTMTAEQKARDILERIGVPGAQDYTAGDLAELANLIAEREHLADVINFIGVASHGELFPVGPADIEYAEDGNTVLRYVGPWYFLDGKGETFLEAVEDEMKNGWRYSMTLMERYEQSNRS